MEKKGTLASPATARANKVFPCSGHPDEEDSLWDLSTEALKLSRSFEKFHNLLQFLFGLVDPGHIGKGHLLILLRIDFGPALSKGHHARLRSDSREEDPPDEEEEDEGNDPGEDIRQPFTIDLSGIFDMVAIQFLHQIRVLHPDRLKSPEAFFSLPLAGDRFLGDGQIFDLARLKDSLNSL